MAQEKWGLSAGDQEILKKGLSEEVREIIQQKLKPTFIQAANNGLMENQIYQREVYQQRDYILLYDDTKPEPTNLWIIDARVLPRDFRERVERRIITACPSDVSQDFSDRCYKLYGFTSYD